MKYMKEFKVHFSQKPAFSVGEANLFLKNREASDGYNKLVIHNLLSRNEIYRVAKGIYTFHEDAQMVGYGFVPFYYGLEDALSLRNVWEQETNPVVITPRKVRPGVRQFEGRNFVVRRIDRKMFFGYSLMRYDDFSIPVSDIEKTFLDLIYFKVRLPREVMLTVLSRSNKAVLKEYIRGLPNWISMKLDKIVRELSPS